MKKLILPISLVLLLGVMTFVIAEMPSSDVTRIEKGTTYDFISGCSKNTGCNEYQGFKTYFKIYKGWNLVPANGEGVASPRTFCLDNPNDFGTSFLKYKFIYFPGVGYIGGKISGNNDNFVDSNTQQRFETQVRSMGEEDIMSFMLSPYWVYSEKSCGEYPAATNFYRDIDRAKSNEVINKIKLKKGWNMFYLHPVFLNEKLKDVIGTCNIEKANVWNPVNQKWDLTSEESTSRVNDLLNTQITEELLYMPLLIKVTDNCKLGSGSEDSGVTPPQVPENSVGCTDSDGGENYLVKGYVSTKDESGKSIRSDDSCELSTWSPTGGYNNQGAWDYTQVYECSANTNNDSPNSKADRCLIHEKTCGEGFGGVDGKLKYCPNGCKNAVCDSVQDLK